MINNVEMNDNIGGSGGALSVTMLSGFVSISVVNMTGNSAKGSGGAVFASDVGSLLLSNLNVSGNAATQDGGSVRWDLLWLLRTKTTANP